MDAPPVKTFDRGKEEITKLCRYFTTNREAFLAPGVKEAHVRQSLIDPLFEALGWDVGNKAMTAPQYREVIPEDSLDVEGQQKAPDYTFRVGSLPKFYAEAKKCGVNIGADPAPAFQLRRYGWSAKLALSILTDFEELGVYDCTMRPRLGEKASHARIQHFHFEEYADRWHELWDVFSREAVWSGAFDQYAASKRKRGTSEVDAEFLKEMEGWRLALAGNIALRNKDLSLDDLNAAVQLTIDRVVFLRMAEDRGLEPYEQLLKLCERPDIYSRFMHDLSRRADQKYNSGLFHFQKESSVSEEPDRITPKLAVDDKVFKPILQGLYFAYGSPYQFGVMPVEILGTVYERFLGKVIRLTAGHQAKIEEKPEVRKAGGVYYTPAYIVEYIVKHTVAGQIEGRSPAQLAGSKDKPPFRVLDMACGSGSFLLGAYRCLLDYCLNWYAEHKPENFKKAVYKDPRDGHWRLTIEERKRILTTHIFGVDIDPQAVEVTKLSLLLKVLEGETDQSLSLGQLAFGDRALPNLADNIKCGNSLIGPDYFTGRLFSDPEEMKRVNPFDWKQGFPAAMKAGGFDCIIGNPPYIRMETFKEVKGYLKASYASHDERSDLYAYFIERAHKLLKRRGAFGMIVSNKFLRANYGKPLRKFMFENATIERVTDFAGLPVFVGATVRTIVFLTSHGKADAKPALYSPPPDMDKFSAIVTGTLTIDDAVKDTTYEVPRNAFSRDVWSFSERGGTDLLANLKARGVPLAKYCDSLIGYGIKTGFEAAFALDGKQRAKLLTRNKMAADIIKPYLNGRDVRRYWINFKDAYLIYTPHGISMDKYPAVLAYLEPFKERLKNRATKQEWYELQQPQFNYAPYFEGSKIVFPDIAKEPRFALDEVGFYGSTTTFFVAPPDRFLLGILNSKLSGFYFSRTCAALEGKQDVYLRFKRQYVENFPVCKLDSSHLADKARHDRIVALVNSMLGLHKQLAAAKSAAQKAILQRQIEATDRQIDQLVYQLYGLTDEEIALIEGRENPRSDGRHSAPRARE